MNQITKARKSISRRVQLVVLSIIALSISLFAVAIVMVDLREMNETVRLKSHNIATLSSLALSEPLWNYDDEGIKRFSEAAILDPDVVAIEVKDKDGETKFIRLLTDGFAYIDEYRSFSRFIVEERKITKSEEFIGSVALVISKDRYIQTLEMTLIGIIIFSLGMLAFTAIAISLLIRRMVKRPIDALQQKAAELANGEWDTPIDTDREDELGVLAKGFAQMRDAIKRKIEDLKTLNTTSEQLNNSRQASHVFGRVLKVLERYSKTDLGVVYTLDGNGEFLATYGNEEENFTERVAGDDFHFQEVFANQHLTLQPASESKLTAINHGNLLLLPLFQEQDRYGMICLYVEDEAIDLDDSMKSFCEALGRATVTRALNLAMMETIAEQNRSLERKVTERTAELRQKTNDINAILQNLRQGVCTFEEDLCLHKEYSQHLESILERRNLAGHNIVDLLFSASDLSSDRIQQIETALAFSIGQESFGFEANFDCLPAEIRFVTAKKEEKLLELEWASIIDDRGIVQKVILSCRDVTVLRKLQSQAQQQQEELDIIGQILSCEPSRFDLFVESCQQLLQESEALLAASNHLDESARKLLLRNLHSIKGNARANGFSFISNRVHEAESEISELQQQSQLSLEHVRHWHQIVHDEIHRYIKTSRDTLGRDKQNEQLDISRVVSCLQQSIAETRSSAADAGRLVEDFQSRLSNLHRPSQLDLRSVFEGLAQESQRLAANLNKITPVIKLDLPNLIIDRATFLALETVLHHLLANSLDHGLEPTEERRSIGKSGQGTISINAQLQEPDVLKLTYGDDGRGLAITKIAERARQLGLLPKDADDMQIASLILDSGLSTASQVTEISGRGVGMDAVHDCIQRLGGRLAIRFTDREEGADFRHFEIDIELKVRPQILSGAA